ncbi:hypothetical protein C8Q76DRAFT_790715 [Earliella scabrosa]|nr:hypothetical protein C8Q76DRAFT_790715 [Earliella scabrosa]
MPPPKPRPVNKTKAAPEEQAEEPESAAQDRPRTRKGNKNKHPGLPDLPRCDPDQPDRPPTPPAQHRAKREATKKAEEAARLAAEAKRQAAIEKAGRLQKAPRGGQGEGSPSQSLSSTTASGQASQS